MTACARVARAEVHRDGWCGTGPRSPTLKLEEGMRQGKKDLAHRKFHGIPLDLPCFLDCLDLMARSMTAKRRIRRWPMLIFFDMFDMASIAAFVILKSKLPDSNLSQKDNRRFSQLEIAKGLMIPQIERRMLKNTHVHVCLCKLTCF